jgi:hypothetical protein
VETTTQRKREREKEGENNKKKIFTQRFLSLSPPEERGGLRRRETNC